MTTNVRPHRRPYPLTGEQIAAMLTAAGLGDDDAVLDLVVHQPTRRHLNVIVELGGPTEVPDWAVMESQSPWHLLGELVTSRLTRSELLAWRNAGFLDWEVARLSGVVNVDLAVLMRRLGAAHIETLPELVTEAALLRIPRSELPLWAAAGVLTPGGDPAEQLAVVVLWRDRLGARAARYAAAGFTLDDAVEVDRRGDYDRRQLQMLTALRSAA